MSEYGGDPDIEMQAAENLTTNLTKRHEKREKLPKDIPPYSPAGIWWRRKGDRKTVIKQMRHHREDTLSAKQANELLDKSLEKYPAALKKFPGNGQKAIGDRTRDPWEKARDEKRKAKEKKKKTKKPLTAGLLVARYKFLRIKWLLAASAIGFQPYPDEPPDKNGLYWRTIEGRSIPFEKGANFKETLDQHRIDIKQNVPIAEEELKKPFTPGAPERMHEYFQKQESEPVRFQAIHTKFDKMIKKTPDNGGWTHDMITNQKFDATDPKQAKKLYEHLISTHDHFIEGEPIYMLATTQNPSDKLNMDINRGWQRAEEFNSKPMTGMWKDKETPYLDVSIAMQFDSIEQCKAHLADNQQLAAVRITPEGKHKFISINADKPPAGKYNKQPTKSPDPKPFKTQTQYKDATGAKV